MASILPTVFVVQHLREDADTDTEHVKLIGVYASRSEADAAVGRVRDQPGFRDYPDGFSVDGYEVGSR